MHPPTAFRRRPARGRAVGVGLGALVIAVAGAVGGCAQTGDGTVAATAPGGVGNGPGALAGGAGPAAVAGPPGGMPAGTHRVLDAAWVPIVDPGGGFTAALPAPVATAAAVESGAAGSVEVVVQTGTDARIETRDHTLVGGLGPAGDAVRAAMAATVTGLGSATATEVGPVTVQGLSGIEAVVTAPGRRGWMTALADPGRQRTITLLAWDRTVHDRLVAAFRLV